MASNPPSAAPDIVNAIVDRLIEVFLLELQTNVALDDPLRLLRCEEAPLQDDPTTEAPFVLVMADPEMGSIPDPDVPYESGGGPKWVNFVRVVGRTPATETKTEARYLIGSLKRRLIIALWKHWNLTDLVCDSGEEVYFLSPIHNIGRAVSRIMGGDGEWYGEVRVLLMYHTEEPHSVWP